MAELLRPDLCIVGAGALGLHLSQHARRLGAGVVLVDRGTSEPFDGPDGPVRLAALQASAARAQAQRSAASFGIAATQPKISFRAIAERLADLAAQGAPRNSDERMSALGIDILRGAPRFVDQQTLQLGETQIRAGTTILALGAAPALPDIPGLGDIDSFNPDTILESSRKLTHLLVIGSDPSAFALSQAFVRLGSSVTLVTQGPALADFDPETTAILLSCLANEGVRIVAGTVMTLTPRSQGIGATVETTEGETLSLDLSHVLVAMGGTADLTPLDPATARLRPRRATGYVAGELGQTSNRRIRLVGAAAGIDQWQHALRHGSAVVEAALHGTPRAKLGPQPRLVLTEPALAQIGRLAGPTDKAKPGSIFRASLAENDAARASGQAEGLAKVTTAADGTILGASLVGPGAADMAAVLGLAMERGLTLDKMADLSLPHPSLFSTISSLGENYLATRPVSRWTARRRTLRRIIPF